MSSVTSKKILCLLTLLFVGLPFSAQASLFFNLVDDATGQAIMRRSNGFEEPFVLPTEHTNDDSIVVFGLSTKQPIRMRGRTPIKLNHRNGYVTTSAPVDYLDERQAMHHMYGFRFQVKDTGRWVRLERWPYDALESLTNLMPREEKFVFGSYRDDVWNRPASRFKRDLIKRVYANHPTYREEPGATVHWKNSFYDRHRGVFGGLIVKMKPDNSDVQWAKFYMYGFSINPQFSRNNGPGVDGVVSLIGFASPKELRIFWEGTVPVQGYEKVYI